MSLPAEAPEEVIAAFARAASASPSTAAVLTDFDGTLAPIVADPAAAVPLSGTAEVLAALAHRYGTVGVVSGRPVSYLQDRLGAAAATLSLRGLYGLERSDDGVVTEDEAAAGWRAVLDRFAQRAEREAPAGATVERKGLAVTLHIRNASGADGWLEDFVAREVGGSGLTAHPGRRSLEVRPPVATDKGTVVRELGAGRSAVCFLGDDRGDLPAFEALADLAGQGTATLAVAVGSDEAPPELLAAADVVVESPTAALAVLRRLAG